MKISVILKETKETRFSLEVFPPKTGVSERIPIQRHLSNIFETVEHLIKYNPIFVSVTYNPEGKTKTTSIPLAAIIKQKYNVEAVAHLTCISTPREELSKTLDVIDYFDIENILALRGDLPDSSLPRGELRHASDLVEEITKHEKGFCIGVACYPEGHPECVTEEGERDLEKDLLHFKAKVDKGADFAITQLFFDNNVFFSFVKKARDIGVKVPIIPGIMPIRSYNMVNIVKRLGNISMPYSLVKKLEDNRDNKAEIMEIGVEQAIKQCRGLMNKVPCIHFYTMDRWMSVDRILKELS
ncbi:MAG TPA: 5,10-methylenetetrahydrofolate reductase [Thermoplasmatales archaeon]|nr:5,10-methylenetetrahydrofolate reductase [Thermoplasmatales archaeon]